MTRLQVICAQHEYCRMRNRSPFIWANLPPHCSRDASWHIEIVCRQQKESIGPVRLCDSL